MSCISICSWWWWGYHINLSVRISDRTEKESDQIAPKRETGLQCRARFVVSLAIKQTYTIRIDLLVFFFFFYYFCHTSPRTVKVFRFLPLSAASHSSSSNSNKTSLCCTSSRHWLTHFFFYQVLKNLLFVFNVPDGKNRILSSCTPPRANHVPTFSSPTPPVCGSKMPVRFWAHTFQALYRKVLYTKRVYGSSQTCSSL